MAEDIGVGHESCESFGLRSDGADDGGVGGMGRACPADAKMIPRELSEKAFGIREEMIPFDHFLL